MSLVDLQKWLFDEGIQLELNALTKRIVSSELDNVSQEGKEEDWSFDWPRLLFAGSILARSDERPHLEAALRVATAAVTISNEIAIKDAGAVLLNKLSNFRAKVLAENRELIALDLNERLGLGLRIESQRRQIESSILIESKGQWLPVNEFQQQFWDSASKFDWVSASAPTASGKTFVVMQWLIDQMLASKSRVAVYLAPTRALVSEIETYLQSLIGKSELVQVSSLPLREKFDLARNGGSKLILVFTQERLHLLANVIGSDLKVDLLVVDEAQKIGDHQRGVILQDAIERVGRMHAPSKVVFVSPATKNPEELLSDAPPATQIATVDTDVPTVLQNLIVAEQAPRKPKQWLLTLRQHGASINLGSLHLRSSPNTLKKRIAFIAAAVGERGGTLVYANGASEAEEVALLISQLLPPIELDQDLEHLADLARKGVHPNYGLAPLVEKGVAFHYGNMPSLIRLEIEDLFRRGKIRFLICTSTLIEGVNLSCRTIVLRGPRKGMGHPMEPHDFWNLAGRAGRWGDEFQGNIICIDPNEKSAWPSGIPARARYPIKRESDVVLQEGDGMVRYLQQRATTPLAELEDSDHFEQVGAYLLSTYLRLGSIKNADIAKRLNHVVLENLEQSLGQIAEKIEIGIDIVERHPGVSAVGLQQLLKAFRDYEGDVENLLPAAVDSQDSYDRFVTIMRRINSNLYQAFMPEGLIPLHARIVVQWLKGYSLSFMIKSSIDYHKRNNRPYKLAQLIRQTMEVVEQTARFRAPKFFSAYIDVLHMHLKEIGRQELIDDGLDIGTQLEFGVSSRTLLSLMELGLSRMTAVALYEKIALDDLTRDACLNWIFEHEGQFSGMDIPAIIVREIRSKISMVKN